MRTSNGRVQKNYRLNYSPESDFYTNISELKKYYEESLEDFPTYEDCQDNVSNEYVQLPQQLNFTLESLFKRENQEKVIPTNREVHNYLMSKLVIDLIPEVTSFKDKYQPNELLQILRQLNSDVKKSITNTFHIHAAFGYYLNQYFDYYNKLDDVVPWNKFVKTTFNLSERHVRDLRSIGRLVNTYPKLKYLSITLKDFIKNKKNILILLNSKEFQHMWK